MQSNAIDIPLNEIPESPELERLAAETGKQLLQQQLRCALAESCTGGLVAKLLTDIAGSSEWFEAGVVCYSNAAKHHFLGVPEHVLETAGAVSEEVVEALSVGALASTGADVAAAISGVAGPGGGSASKPVGTVWIAWATAGAGKTSTRAQRYQIAGNRDQVRRAAAGLALRGILAPC